LLFKKNYIVFNHAKLFFVIAALFCNIAVAQFVDITQNEPFANPTSVCAGGVLTFRLNNLQNLNNGCIIKMELSALGGGFPGTVLTTVEHSFNNTTWITGDFIWTSNVTNSYIRVNVPASAVAGIGYNARAVSSAPNMAGSGNNNSITITAPIVTIPIVPETDYGIGEWFGHVYSWTPTTTSYINTAALVASQNFFATTNYKGHVVKSTLSFDDNFISSGFLGATGFYNQTSIGCGNNMASNFAMRYKRKENFTPGLYTISIQADDGVRLSIDGGATWLLNSFVEQQFNASLQTTATLNPSGICMGGLTDLVVEYFQHPADAHIKITVTQLSTTVNNPIDVTICTGQDASFDATATDVGATYQWQVFNAAINTWVNLVNTTSISGSNSGILNIINIPILLNGTQYRCIVTNSCPQPITTQIATLTVQGNTGTFASQPANTTVCAGTNTTLSAIFTTIPAVYQWYYSADNGITFIGVSNTANFSNVITSTLNISAIPIGFNNYLFMCSCIGSCGNPVFSDTITLTVNNLNPTITAQPNPVSDTVCVGQSTQFTIITNATNVIWQLSVDGGLLFTDMAAMPGITGQSTATLIISNATLAMNNYFFRCRLPACSSNVFSDSCSLHVKPNSTIVTQPTINNTVCVGDNIALNITATGINNYQWFIIQQNITTALVNVAPISGSTATMLNITNVPLIFNGATLYCTVTGDCGIPINSDSVTINMNPTSVLQPTNLTVCSGQNANFTLGSNGNTLTYQWYISVDNGATFSALVNALQFTGVSTNALQVNSCNQNNNGNLFYCAYTNSCNIVANSDTVSLQLNSLSAIINIQPHTITVCEGQVGIFSCAATNNTSYQWQVSIGGVFLNLSDNSIYSGTATASISISPASIGLNGSFYRCLVGSCGGQIVTDSAKLIVVSVQAITQQPNDVVMCPNEASQSKITVAGTNNFFQWQVQDNTGTYVNLSISDTVFLGVHSNTLTIKGNLKLDKLKFRCLVSNNCVLNLESDESFITILKETKIDTEPISVELCEGANTYFTFAATGDSVNYTWYLSEDSGATFTQIINTNSLFDSITSSTLIANEIKEEQNGWQFFCVVPSCNKTLFSDTVTLKVKSRLMPLYIPNSFTPNGDALNETLEFVGIKNTPVEGDIFDRWGANLFHFSKTNNIWDGKYLGSILPAGVYPYTLKTDVGCSLLPKAGFIQIIR